MEVDRLTSTGLPPSLTAIVRTDELLRRVAGLDQRTLDACQSAGYVIPEAHLGGDDPRWWSDADMNKLRDILSFKRQGLELGDAFKKAAEDRFFGLCPCDWR